MIGKRIRHTKRYQEILNAFMRNGFSHLLFRIGLTNRNLLQNNSTVALDTNLQDIGKRLRLTMQQLGPAFIKLGQIASTRHDALPPEITTEMEKLQDDVQIFPFEEVRTIIEEELNDQLENLFSDFQQEALATASIGQIHVARLFSGEEVVVKVQRPNIEDKMVTDLEILQGLAKQLEERTTWAKRYRIQDIIHEFSASLHNELNYISEGHNAERIGKQFTNISIVQIPEIYWDYTTEKVLTMEMMKGIKITDCARLDEEGYDRNVIAKRFTDSMFHQILNNGYFHGDPHPGNIFIQQNNVISYVDFGVVGRIGDELKYDFASIIVNLQQKDSDGIIKTFYSMEIMGDDTDTQALKRELDELHLNYEEAADMQEVSLGKIIVEIFSIAYRHDIQIPSEIAILSKVILIIEGVVATIAPDFSIMRAVEPYAKKLIRQRFNPKNIIRRSMNELVDNIEVLTNLPRDLQEIMSTVRKGKVKLDINIKQLQTVLHRLDRISNRLSFSIILLAFSILMTGLIIGAAITGQTTKLLELPVIEIGAGIAALMFIFMIFTIIKSGRM